MTFTQHELDVLDLLRSLYAWCPGPKTSTGAIVARSALPGEAATARRDCLACEGGGRRRQRGIVQACERCRGRGFLLVDAYTGRQVSAETSPEEPGFDLVAEIRADLALVNADPGSRADVRAERKALMDRSIERLERNARIRDGLEAPGDLFTGAHEARERQYAQGSYAALDRALTLLCQHSPADYTALLVAEVLDDVDRRVGPLLRARAERALRRLAAGLPEPLRVPGWARSERWDDPALKGSLWRGRAKLHITRRAERKQRILALHAQGMAPGKIGELVGLTRQRVGQIIAEELAHRPLVGAGFAATGAAGA